MVKFNSAGVRQWGTFYGGLGNETGVSCCTNKFGTVYLSGTTNSNNGTTIATASGHQPNVGGGTSDAFLVRFDSLGNRQLSG